ncbi:MAG: hypothetical protein AAF492_12200 [Verrucomicrobiota bacterium]
MQPDHSKARELSGYSFLVVFANDDTISESELTMMKKIALRDGMIDEEEKSVLRDIFARANTDHMEEKTRNEIQRFRERHDI